MTTSLLAIFDGLFKVGNRSVAINMQFAATLSIFSIFNRIESKLDFRL
jgi:hypothetical protein